MTESELAELLARFRAAAIPRPEWTHAAHLAVGACFVHELGRDAALVALRSAIQRLNERNGVPNSPSDGYHETITAAYVELLAQFQGALDASVPRADLVTQLLASPLAEREYLLRFYSKALLFSAQARAAWVAPDLAPLALPMFR